jgi:hypothetical protein
LIDFLVSNPILDKIESARAEARNDPWTDRSPGVDPSLVIIERLTEVVLPRRVFVKYSASENKKRLRVNAEPHNAMLSLVIWLVIGVGLVSGSTKWKGLIPSFEKKGTGVESWKSPTAFSRAKVLSANVV